jgi:hypothetical protein
MHAQRALTVSLKRGCCTHNEVILREYPSQVLAADLAVIANVKVKCVAPVDQHED